ncbi:MAG: NUDIX domain-containing protein [Deltaproteobacteria bacterium]|nr:NUDIX domain-containing protein [Deltaproteobacteria bacterium]MBW2541213.1 NUDIX domain-containing protein [Deltaproteobacteria bacterium]
MTRYFAKNPTRVRLTVSAVARRDGGNGEILLIQRADNAHWGLPGGHVEPGESVAQAVAREVLEETGFAIEVGRLVGVYSEPDQQTVQSSSGECSQFVNLCFDARVTEEVGSPSTPHETLDLGFFAVDALPQPFVPIHTIRIEDSVSQEPGARVR